MHKKKMEYYEFEGWIELPYFVGIKYSKEIDLDMPGRKPLKAYVEFRNDLLKIWTGNEFDYHREYKQFETESKEESNAQFETYNFWPLYKSRDEIDVFKKNAENDKTSRYVHIEIPETVVEIKASISDPYMVDVASISFVIIPYLSKIIDAYRIAAIPSIRYEIHPLTEENAETMIYVVKDQKGGTIGPTPLGLDTNSSRGLFHSFGKKFRIQERFEDILGNIQNRGLENQMSVASNLWHMRRGGEAVIVAAAVTDELTKSLFYEITDEKDADSWWEKSKFRSRERN